MKKEIMRNGEGDFLIQDLKHFVQVAQGNEPAELVIKDARIYSSFTGEIIAGDIAIEDGYIAGIGTYDGKKEMFAGKRFALPGFIDGHIHIESSMMSPAEYVKTVVPLGTTTIVNDPHEIANVAGINGIKYMIDATADLPMNVYFTLPSCVPATNLEHSGAILLAEDLLPLLNRPEIIGLSEFMNVPGILFGDDVAYDKLQMRDNLHIEGHAPGLAGNKLMAYRAAGVTSDHECITREEGRERLRAGMYLQIREGSAAQNLEKLAPLVTGQTAPFCMFVTDDCHAADLLTKGHLNYVLKKARQMGIDNNLAINMVTINPARYFGFKDIGAIAPGYRADILLFDDFDEYRPYLVLKDGQIVAKKGEFLAKLDSAPMLQTGGINFAPLSEEQLRIRIIDGKLHIIGIVPHQIITEHIELNKPNEEFAEVDAEKDLLKLVVIERHHATGNVGTALIKGFGLKKGAVASTVAHDSHNLVIIGTNDADILAAAEEIKRIGGGFAIVADGKVLGSLPLPIGGLMAPLSAKEIAQKHEELTRIAHELGVYEYNSPFSLVFLSLPVIPSLKLTDRGLVDVDRFRIIK